uniref:SCP domain-containing protein n=1 Tax=Parastrongyloides trichosuri TaxID=131310 RepID=A0A0N4ZLS3_PARTI
MFRLLIKIQSKPFILLFVITSKDKLKLKFNSTFKFYDETNCYREGHQADPLEIDNDLQAQAQAYADKLLSDDQGLIHSDSGGAYGENLAWVSDESIADTSVKMWYDENADYDYSSPGFSGDTGHFTQLVWKGSQKVGCGIASGSGGVYTVCQYKPPGNYEGEFEDNVLPDENGSPEC